MLKNMDTINYNFSMFTQPIHNGSKPNSGLRPAPIYMYEPDVINTPFGRDRLVSASRSLYANNGVIKSAIDKKSTYSIGRAFLFRSKAEKHAEKYDEFIENFYKVACVDGMGFMSLLYMISTAIDIDGDCFIKLIKNKNGFPSFQFLRANRINSVTGVITDGKYKDLRCFCGVVMNKQGKEVAYCLDNNFVDASEFVHAKDFSFLASSRGDPLFSHAVNAMQMADDIDEAELHAMKILSQIAVVEKSIGDGAMLSDDQYSVAQNGGTIIREMGNGQVLCLQAGQGVDVSVPSSSRPTPNYMAFTNRINEKILAGAGVPYDIAMTPQSGGVGNRVSLNVFDNTCSDRTTLLQEISKKLIEFALACGIDAGFIPPSPKWWAMNFSRPRKPSVDLGRDSSAMINEYKAGLRTLEQICEENGTTLEDHIKEIKKEQDLLKEYGLLTIEKNESTSNQQ